MAKRKLLKSDSENPITGIAIPCNGSRNKQLRGASISNMTFSGKDSGGKITVEFMFSKVEIVRENDQIKDDFVFIRTEDGEVKGKAVGLEIELKNLIKNELRPAEAAIVFKFGASKVGPGSGKVGPGSGTGLKAKKRKK